MPDEKPQKEPLSKDDPADQGGTVETTTSSDTEPSRRGFAIASVILGGIVSLGPALIGLFAFLDPLQRIIQPKQIATEGETVIRKLRHRPCSVRGRNAP